MPMISATAKKEDLDGLDITITFRFTLAQWKEIRTGLQPADLGYGFVNDFRKGIADTVNKLEATYQETLATRS